MGNSARQLVCVNKEGEAEREREKVSQFRELLSTKDSASGYGQRIAGSAAKTGGSIA